ncbi:hypothetical protein AALO_G00009050, partial [Alosa alosa]
MIHSLIKHFTRYSKAQADYTLTCPSCWIYDAKGFGEMMVKNKVKTPAKAKGKRLTVAVQSSPKVTPNATDPTHTTLSHAKKSHVKAPSNSTAHTSHTTYSLTPSQTASSLTMPSGVTQDVSPSATNMGSTSSYTLELTLPTVSSSTNSHHTNSTMPAAEAQSTPDPEQQSSPSGWEQCSPDAQSQWGAVADRVYVHAAAIFDHARNEKPGGLGVVRYGQKSESPPCS